MTERVKENRKYKKEQSQWSGKGEKPHREGQGGWIWGRGRGYWRSIVRRLNPNNIALSLKSLTWPLILPSWHLRAQPTLQKQGAINSRKRRNGSHFQVECRVEGGRVGGVRGGRGCENDWGPGPGKAEPDVTWHLAGEPPGGQAVRTTDSQLSRSQVMLLGGGRSRRRRWLAEASV